MRRITLNLHQVFANVYNRLELFFHVGIGSDFADDLVYLRGRVFDKRLIIVKFPDIFLVVVEFLVDTDIFRIGELFNFVGKDCLFSTPIFFGVTFDFRQKLSLMSNN